MIHSRTALALLAGLSLVAVGCSSGSKPTSYPQTSQYRSGSEESYSKSSPAGQPGFDGAPPTAPPPETAAPAPGMGESARADRAPSRAPADEPFKEAAPEFRPGLATQWGETRSSRVTSAPFARADQLNPFALGKLFYNDPRGVAAMAGGLPRVHHAMFPVGRGFVEIGLKGEHGRFINGFTAGGNNYTTGVAGERYSILVKNKSPGRIEIVVSVDGLDVIDGQPAAPAKRGYLLDAFGDVEIEGFRTSTNAVAAFRFGSVEQSYAELKHGDSRNVGVIGIALFNERGDSPSNWPLPGHDADRRHDADPFPMRFADPPR